MIEAVEKTGSTTNWSQHFGYDRYGNRTGFSRSIGQSTLNTTPAVNENTNRFTAGQGFGYDKNGNVVSDIDPLSQLPRTFIFNGDNKQTEVKRDGVTVGRYYYDGEGKRVKKITDSETTVFVYSSGKLIAEYSTQLSPNPSVAYTMTDHLGTPRIITNELGQVKARRDFMPFGEELYVNIGGRSTNLNYGTSEDDIRKKFTGYQKDNETGLDFAEARMYENRHARFTAVDPLLASGKSGKPQTFNRYVYAGNNPVIRIDPNGEDWIIVRTRQSVELKDKRGRVIGSKEQTIETPEWVDRASPTDDLAPNIWRVANSTNSGWQALHPTDGYASATFSSKEEAQAVFAGWMNEVTDGISSTVPSNSARLYSWIDPLGYGHSSLQLSDGTYISFYPDNHGKESGLSAGESQTANPLTIMTRDWGGEFKNVDYDFRMIRAANYFQRPTATAIPELNESVVNGWFNQMRKSPPRWSAGNNCTSICIQSMQVGGVANVRPFLLYDSPLQLLRRVENRSEPQRTLPKPIMPPLLGPRIF